MKSWQKYFEVMQGVVESVLQTQEGTITKAAEILTNTTKNNGIIHLFGSGHSSLIAEDVFWRAATLANVHAIFESAVAGINEVTKTSKIEKLEGSAGSLLNTTMLFLRTQSSAYPIQVTMPLRLMWR